MSRLQGLSRPEDYLLRGLRLLPQFLVYAYCKIETRRLRFLRQNQTKLRADTYQNLKDSMLAIDGVPNQVGQRIDLPSSYADGPCYLHACQTDVLAYVQMGPPELFITMTTNPQWDDIQLAHEAFLTRWSECSERSRRNR